MNGVSQQCLTWCKEMTMTDLQFEKLCRTIDSMQLNQHLTLEQKMFVSFCKQMLEAYRAGDIHTMLEVE